jgi:hypothetical protein
MEATPAELQRRIAAEFDKQGWEYALGIGPDLVALTEGRGPIDAETVAAAVPQEFLQNNGTRREDVAAAIQRAIGGLSVRRDTVATSLVINDNRYQVNLEAGSRIVASNINVGDGTQLNIDASATKSDVLSGVEVLLRAGLNGKLNVEAARELGELINGRSDISLEDIQRVTVDVVEAEKPKMERLKEFLNEIAIQALGGAMGTGIAAAIGSLMT